MEQWKPVKNFEGLYEVSSVGRIRRTDGRILKTNTKKNGYEIVCLHRECTKKTMHVHRIVATAFYGEPQKGMVVNHINCCPNDNRVENLEWVTQSRNIKYAYELGRAENVARKRILCVETNEVFYSSIPAAAWIMRTKKTSKNIETVARTIRTACGARRETAYGYHWKHI